MTVSEIFESVKDSLFKGSISEPENEARLLLEIYCDINRSDLVLNKDKEISEDKLEALRGALNQRITHRPLWYITGKAPFMGLDFSVDERVLIPRADTEILVEEALRDLRDGSRILDMCTGSGCILISLLKYSNDCSGVGVDISEGALEVSKQNAADILGKEVDIKFVQSDLFENVDGTYEVIVSNPPYIASKEVDGLMPEVKDYEPRMALDGEESGLVFYEKIIPEAKKRLAKGGSIYFEIGYDQGEAVRELLEKEGFIEVRIIKDYAGLDRVACAVKSVLDD
ncbi:MAG: peptide chain release factor N(5)-glutamine methyltransferase [Lachnospiraceae bacterium]|nr:peptide chain release factor N(5)-glutamine methyltransferase [Lachnospiraceae bacterium]